MKDVSVEYAHIYTNNKIGREHELSLAILGEVRRNIEAAGETSSLVIMIDDYSFPDPTFNYDEFLNWLENRGFSPNIVIRESQLIPLCDQVLKRIKNEKLHDNLIDYIKTKKYPCSLFIAAWYLLRLGKIKSEIYNSDFVSKRLLNILPESFKPFEDQALKIIEATDFSGAEKQIEYSFIDGRLLA